MSSSCFKELHFQEQRYSCTNIFLTDSQWSEIWQKNKAKFATLRYSVLCPRVSSRDEPPSMHLSCVLLSLPILTKAIIMRNNTVKMQVHSIQSYQFISKNKNKKKKRGRFEQKYEKYVPGNHWQLGLLKFRKDKKWGLGEKGNAIHHIRQMSYCNKVKSVIF